MMILQFLLVSALLISKPDTKLQYFAGNFSEALAKAKNSKKPLMVHFFTDASAASKELDATTFTNSEVISYLNQGYISVKVNAEKGEGNEIAKRYAIKAVPTLMLLDSAGVEIDHFEGYLTGPDFLEDLKELEAGNSFKQLQIDIEKKPNDPKTLFNLGKKWLGRKDKDKAKELFTKIVTDDAEVKSDYAILAKGELAFLEFVEKNNANILIDFASKYPDPKYALDAHKRLVQIYAQRENIEAAEASFEYIQKNDHPNPEWINRHARYLCDNNRNLARALELSQKAIALVPRDPRFYLTQAECQYRLKQYQEAVESQKKAIALAGAAKGIRKLEERLQEFQDAANKAAGKK